MPDAALAGLPVLVVEDEFWPALCLADMLDELGCRVLGPAATVEDALRLLAAAPPRAALLDVDLRGTRATAVAEALLARGVPFVVVTAYGSPPEPVFAAAPLIAKPPHPYLVRDALLRLVPGSP